MPIHSAFHRPRRPRRYETTPHSVLARRFQELANSPRPNHQELSAIHRTLGHMESLGRDLRICRGCYQRGTTDRNHRYCFITCRGPHKRAELEPDPSGELRLAFDHSPSLWELRALLNRQFPIPPHLLDPALIRGRLSPEQSRARFEILTAGYLSQGEQAA